MIWLLQCYRVRGRSHITRFFYADKGWVVDTLRCDRPRDTGKANRTAACKTWFCVCRTLG
jgi:hypothetical protein